MINLLKDPKGEPLCKGLFFRAHVNSYISSHSSIEVKKSLRLLKRKSCPGCGRCGGLWEQMAMDISDGGIEDYAPGIEDGKIYMVRATWQPGGYEYPNEGELDIDFVKINKFIP